MKPVVATLRNLGIRLIIYLGDLLILANSEQTARLHLATAQSLLENLGFVINLKKVSVVPSTENRVSRYDCGFVNILPCPSQGQSQEYSQGMRVFDCKSQLARQLAHLLGRLSSSIQAVFPAPLYYRYLQEAKIQAFRSGDTTSLK